MRWMQDPIIDIHSCINMTYWGLFCSIRFVFWDLIERVLEVNCVNLFRAGYLSIHIRALIYVLHFIIPFHNIFILTLSWAFPWIKFYRWYGYHWITTSVQIIIIWAHIRLAWFDVQELVPLLPITLSLYLKLPTVIRKVWNDGLMIFRHLFKLIFTY